MLDFHVYHFYIVFQYKQKQSYSNINSSLYIKCGKCVTICDESEHSALSITDGKVVVDTDKCVGCSFCSHVCPKLAINMK